MAVLASLIKADKSLGKSKVAVRAGHGDLRDPRQAGSYAIEEMADILSALNTCLDNNIDQDGNSYRDNSFDSDLKKWEVQTRKLIFEVTGVK